MNVIVTALIDHPVTHRALDHHVHLRHRPRPASAPNLKFRELISPPANSAPLNSNSTEKSEESQLTTQVAGKKGFNKLTK